jgi:hypothetical protein
MATLPVFSMGENASASLMNEAFTLLQSQGNSILETMAEIQLTTVVDYQRRLTALNGRQQRAASALFPYTLVKFVVSDFDTINQGITTSTIRVDTAAANLRERRQPSQVLVSATSFISTIGTVQSIDSNDTLFSVYSLNGIPTGTFNLTLASVVDVSFITVDVSAMASSPDVSVSVSTNGLVWEPAVSVSLSGSLLNAWLPEIPTKYIQIVITPTHPDNLGGNTYTFGVTGLSGTTVDYNLVSDIYFNPQTFNVESSQVIFKGDSSDGLTYYLTLYYLESGVPTGLVTVVISPGEYVDLPGVTDVIQSTTTTAGVLGITLPSNFIPNTVSVTDSSNNSLAVVPGLSTTDPNISYLTVPRVSLVGDALTVVPNPTDGTPYTVNYLTGPSSVVAALQVHLTTNTKTLTPIFSGASLEVS